MGSLVHVALTGPSVASDPRPATGSRPVDTPSVAAWRAPAAAGLPGASGAAAAPRTAGAGIVLVHDAWGLDDEVKNLADALAGAGFTVLAPDLAAGWQPRDLGEAEALAATMNPEDVGRVLVATVDALRADPAVDGMRVGAVGLGMGAPLAAFLATLRAEVAAAVLAGPGPDLGATAWARTEAAFLALPPAEWEAAVDEATAWADAVRACGLDVTVAPAPVPPIDAPEPATAAAAADASLPGAVAFLRRHLG